MQPLKIVTATKSKLLTSSGFKGYDICLNPYVGCQFGCRFCYVRFFVTDPERDWGEFVRLREHIHTKLPKELATHVGQRLVIGTMTDGYQPLERKHRLTRAALEHILAMAQPLDKVGIFTRSPLIMGDIDLVKRLPRARVHFSVSPFTDDVIRKMEPVGITQRRRWTTIKMLKLHGIRVHVNVAPALPILSDELIEPMAAELHASRVDEYFIDPMQAYSEAWTATAGAMQDHPRWGEVAAIVSNKDDFNAWKLRYKLAWRNAWEKYHKPTTLPIWSDHVHHVWENLITGETMDFKAYGDDLYEKR